MGTSSKDCIKEGYKIERISIVAIVRQYIKHFTDFAPSFQQIHNYGLNLQTDTNAHTHTHLHTHTYTQFEFRE